jgi:hypothetical protein
VIIFEGGEKLEVKKRKIFWKVGRICPLIFLIRAYQSEHVKILGRSVLREELRKFD